MTNYVTVKLLTEPHLIRSGDLWHYSHMECICGRKYSDPIHAKAIETADAHARRCPTVRIAVERDRMSAHIRELERATARNKLTIITLHEERDRYKAALESCEAAYAAEVRELKAERQEWRNARYTAQDERDSYAEALEAVEQRTLSLRAALKAVMEVM